MNACDVMGSRACGQKPDKDDRETDPIKYCIASRVYFECVHKKYRGCENKEKYEVAMESMMKGIRKRVDDLLAFCSDKIEDYKFKIIWESPKPVEPSAPIRAGVSSKNGFPGLSPIHIDISNDICQIQSINDLCQPLMISVKFNPSWNSANKRRWCQLARTYYHCLKSRLDKCSQQDVQNHFQQREYLLSSNINISCPGGTVGCIPHSPDVRCQIGMNSSNKNSSIFWFTYFFVQSVLQLLFLF
ncbi:unnamed protein product [Adineta steineri]|uniref:Uncharacterized protein n=1 Tax=Adineta steineri TaxID=433720 RepID=A0A819B5D7_9BILA|nr:unnamed protein product [Adineta steineri]CAF3795320.1 unnamed protein product [Adineta steineri]